MPTTITACTHIHTERKRKTHIKDIFILNLPQKPMGAAVGRIFLGSLSGFMHFCDLWILHRIQVISELLQEKTNNGQCHGVTFHFLICNDPKFQPFRFNRQHRIFRVWSEAQERKKMLETQRAILKYQINKSYSTLLPN